MYAYILTCDVMKSAFDLAIHCTRHDVCLVLLIKYVRIAFYS